MRSICFITSSRADYGSLKLLIDEILKIKKIKKIFLIVTGSHNDNTYSSGTEIKKSSRIIIKKIKIKSKNINSYSVIQSFSESIKKYGDILKKLSPESIVIYGDRYEMLSSTIAAYILKINIIHLCGGEKTIGSLDDGYRHCITKLANLHFPSAKEYKKRIIQMGENPSTVFNYGGLHYDKIKKTTYLTKKDIEKKFKFKFLKKNILLTYHPDTIEEEKTLKNLDIILEALKKLKDTLVLITSPNADAKGIIMIKKIKSFIKKNKLKNFKFYKTLGSQNYLSILKFLNGVIGNSSSGISEVPFLRIGTINLGDRQEGRILKTQASIINCSIEKNKISNSFLKLFSNSFKDKIKKNTNIYGTGNSAKKIANKIAFFNFAKYKKKNFFDFSST
jgi:GDP/UDP-N,N'-diacetylbacillosamine 2-epimerase (hydrolysing)